MKRFAGIMGILSLILGLFGCGQGNKQTVQNDGELITEAASITIDRLPDVLKSVQTGLSEYDFAGICSNGVDCIYFVLENGKFVIEYEAMSKDQLPYMERLMLFAAERGYHAVETTYNNTPADYDNLKYAPVLSIKVNADLDSIAKIGKEIEQTIFSNDDRTVYDVVP